MGNHLYGRNLVVPSLKIIADITALELAASFSYWLRFYSPLTEIIPLTKGLPSFSGYFYFSLFISAVYVILFASMHSYRTRLLSNFSQDLAVIFKVGFFGTLFAMSGAFLYRGFSYSRLVFLLIFIDSILFLILERYFFHKLKTYFTLKGVDVFRVYLVGSTDLLKKIIGQFQTGGMKNFKLEGYIADQQIASLSIPYMGGMETLPSLIEKGNFDGLILHFNKSDYTKILEVVDSTEGKNIELFYIPDILDLLTSNYNTIETEGLLLLQLKAFTLSGWQGFLKRIFDIAMSLLSLILLSPFFILIALLVKLTSKGPVFYRQQRLGMDGTSFMMIKFRSMHLDAEAGSGPVWASKNDSRVTFFGRFLRRASFDELPQLFNVLRGEMSLVGPRPERPHFVKMFKGKIPKYLERQRVRSGITGWAQVNGLRGQSPIDTRTRYDIYYIENWSLWFDIKIIILTFIAIFKGENAY